MQFLARPLRWIIQRRLRSLAIANQYPIDSQHKLLHQLLQKGKEVAYGKQFGYGHIKTPQDFRQQVPTCTYEQLYPYIEKILKGEKGVLWPTPINWFAKSSGTTNDRSKFIPVSYESLQEGHYRAGKDMLALYLANYRNSKLLKGKTLGIGGTLQPNPFFHPSPIMCGDISAVMMKNLPCWARYIRVPSLNIALLSNFEEKIEKIIQVTQKEKITALVGVPTWVLLLLNTLLSQQEATHIRAIWPDLEVFIHGGISFKPYKALFDLLVPGMNYMEVYNASEGFFAIQDLPSSEDMLLLVDHGIYYEFIPLEEIDKENPLTVDLADVKLNTIYALVITTNAGLWRYQIGDTLLFTSLQPYRIKLVGRTKNFINTFGEELLIHNAENAIAYACEYTGATISNYTAGPAYTRLHQQGRHEWIIEFVKPPINLETFVTILDQQLQKLNSDYEAKRYKNLVLAAPLVNVVPTGFFYAWLKKHNKIGEQNKVPRLFNTRQYLDDIHQFLQRTNYEVSSWPLSLQSSPSHKKANTHQEI